MSGVLSNDQVQLIAELRQLLQNLGVPQQGQEQILNSAQKLLGVVNSTNGQQKYQSNLSGQNNQNNNWLSNLLGQNNPNNNWLNNLLGRNPQNNNLSQNSNLVNNFLNQNKQSVEQLSKQINDWLNNQGIAYNGDQLSKQLNTWLKTLLSNQNVRI